MKLGPVTKPDKRNKTIQKNLAVTLIHQIVTLWSLFQFMASLEESPSQIPDAQCVKLKFSLIVTSR